MGVAFEQVAQIENVVCAYRPVITKAVVTSTVAALPRIEFLEMVRAAVSWNGVEVVTIPKDWFYRDEVAPGSWEYQYNIDMQRVAQSKLLPNRGVKSGVFGNYNEKRLGVYPPDASGEVSVSCEFYYRDDDNLLKVLTGGPFTNDSLICVPFALPQEEQSYLYGDGRYIFISGGNDFKLLTNMPADGVSVDINDDAWLAWIHHGNFNEVNAYRVTIYNNAGVAIERKILILSELTGGDALADQKGVISIGAGPQQIDQVTTDNDWWFEQSGPDTTYFDSYDYSYYTIQVGYSDPLGLSGNFTGISNLARYNIQKPVGNRAFRIHFLNRFGMAEAYTFDCRRFRRARVASSKGKKGLDWNSSNFATSTQHNIEDYGLFRFGIQSDIIYELESKPLDEEESKWLEELADTPEAYYADPVNNVLVRIVVDDVSDEVVEDSNEFGIKKTLRVTMANSVIRQRF